MTTGLASEFAALGDDTRWWILVRLGEAPASASALATELPISRQAILKHLDVLRHAGLVETRRQGREVRYQPLSTRLCDLGRELDRLGAAWDRRLSSIKRLAEDT